VKQPVAPLPLPYDRREDGIDSQGSSEQCVRFVMIGHPVYFPSENVGANKAA
jgi:hypothetical protein